MTDELIKMLRARRKCKDGVYRQPRKHEREAADRIEALTAENEQLREAQRVALIACVDALDELAGEGFCVAEDAIFGLFSAFDGDPNLNYPEWIRAILKEQSK